MYTTALQAGLGLIAETPILLELWSPGITAAELSRIALRSGRFPRVSARRLDNVIRVGFAPRFMVDDGIPALCLKRLQSELSRQEWNQFLLLFTCRANDVLADFIREVYWKRYSAGYSDLSTNDARAFVERAVDDGKTEQRWSESTQTRVARYISGCCGDFGMLENGAKTVRRFLPFNVTPRMTAYLAYDLHFRGLGDNTILSHPDWEIFGLDRSDVLEEMKRLALKGFVIVQAAGDVVDISWRHMDRETLYDALAER